jgi:hypothetical protein
MTADTLSNEEEELVNKCAGAAAELAPKLAELALLASPNKLAGVTALGLALNVAMLHVAKDLSADEKIFVYDNFINNAIRQQYLAAVTKTSEPAGHA